MSPIWSPSVSGSKERVTDTELSDQYFCASAASSAFSRRETSFSERRAADLIGKKMTDVPVGSSLAGSTRYPAARNSVTSGASLRKRIARLKEVAPGAE